MTKFMCVIHQQGHEFLRRGIFFEGLFSKEIYKLQGDHQSSSFYSLNIAITSNHHFAIPRYKVVFFGPGNELIEEWMSVKNITSLTQAEEKQRENTALNINVPKEKYNVLFNPAGDGDCQYAAVAHQLEGHLGTVISPSDLRRNVREFIEENENDYRPFIHNGASETVSWNDYLNGISTNEYGDHLTLQAITHLYDLQIIVLSNDHLERPLLISPDGQFSHSMATLALFHQSEDNGMHYMSVRLNDFDECVASSECDIFFVSECIYL